MPGGDKAIRPEDGKQFSSTYQPVNRRKPRLFSQLSEGWKAQGIEQATPERVKEAFEFLLALPLNDIRDIAGDPKDDTNDLPMLVRLAAKELLGRKAQDILAQMLDRAHGKSKQASDQNITIENKTEFSKLPFETQLAVLDAINKGAYDADPDAGLQE